MKTIINKIILPATVILFAASCSKEGPQKDSNVPAPVSAPAAVSTPADNAPEPAPIPLPEVMTRKEVNPSEVFSVRRDGQKVTVQILIDFSTCKSIEVSRNTTGVAKYRYQAAELKPEVRQYEDTLPDAQAYWYWIRVLPNKGWSKSFGPLRVEPDAENKGSYEDTHPWTLSRTALSAVISWKFPEAKYRSITLYRNTKRDTIYRKTILETKEWIGTMKDRLPDADADYWYWIVARLENGTIITKGPTKAEFAAE